MMSWCKCPYSVFGYAAAIEKKGATQTVQHTETGLKDVGNYTKVCPIQPFQLSSRLVYIYVCS